MPTIYKYFGLVFFFYSNDHEPIHVHAQRRSGEECKITLIYNKKGGLEVVVSNVKGKPQMSAKDKIIARDFVVSKHNSISRKWTEFFVQKKDLKCITITTKL